MSRDSHTDLKWETVWSWAWYGIAGFNKEEVSWLDIHIQGGSNTGTRRPARDSSLASPGRCPGPVLGSISWTRWALHVSMRLLESRAAGRSLWKNCRASEGMREKQNLEVWSFLTLFCYSMWQNHSPGFQQVSLDLLVGLSRHAEKSKKAWEPRILTQT